MKHFSTIPAILISGLIIAGCSSRASTGADTKTETFSIAEKVAVPVKVATLKKAKIARTLDYTATVLPFEEVNMAPSAPGRIDKIFVEVGERVNRNDDLFLMDRTQLYQLKLQQSSLAKDLSRLDTLLKSGSAKQQQYDQLKTQFDITKTNVDFMEQNTLLKSPFAGVITGKYFEDGEMYSGAPTTQTGRSAVVTVMQINPLKVDVSFSEQYYPLIRIGMKAEITADVYKNEKFTGIVYRVAPTIISATRSFRVELELPNRNELLKPGMFVRVSMDLGEVETFIVPASTVLVQEGTNTRFVFVAAENLSERIDVSIGKRFDDQLEIISEKLKEGDNIITEGQSRLVNGDKILIVR